MRARTILWWLRLERDERGWAREASAALGRCRCTAEITRTTPEISILSWRIQIYPEKSQLRVQPLWLEMRYSSWEWAGTLPAFSLLREGIRAELTSRRRKRDFSMQQSSFSSLHDNRLCGGGGGRGRGRGRRQMQSHRGNFACQVEGPRPRKETPSSSRFLLFFPPLIHSLIRMAAKRERVRPDVLLSLHSRISSVDPLAFAHEGGPQEPPFARSL